MNNRILIASPCYGKVDPEILEDWVRFAYHCGRRIPEFDFFFGLKSKSEQFRARNTIVEGAQQANCDRILMLDDDMIIDAFDDGGAEPGDSAKIYDFIKTLIAHDKPICGILYYQRGGDCHPVLMRKMSEKGYRFLREEEIEHRLQQVDVAGGGCLLIQTRVFDRIAYPYFAPEYEHGTDVQLCRKASDKGFEIWADTSIEFGHMRNEAIKITSRNRHLFQNAISLDKKTTFIASEMYELLIRDVLEFTKRATVDELWHDSNALLNLRDQTPISDTEWYRKFPMERIGRQAYFNTRVEHKKQFTEYILNSIQNQRSLRILDFGCGIGIPAFALAEKGHQVTAMDIRGTGTFEFLQWRSAKYNVPMNFLNSDGGPPILTEIYDVIIAMDSIEHIAEWRETVKILSDHLRPGGVLFSNNAILDDMTHPEHYEVRPKAFLRTCNDCDLRPLTQLSYVKYQEESVYA